LTAARPRTHPERRSWGRTGLARTGLARTGLARVAFAAVGIGYSGVLGACLTVLHLVPPQTRQDLLAWASTDLDNLADHPVGALLASAFLAQAHSGLWVVLALVGLTSTGRVLGNARTALLVAVAHLVGTAVSEGILWYRIQQGGVPAGSRHFIDVGPSYVVACALVTAIVFGRWPGRLLSAAGFAVIGPFLFLDLPELEVSSVGHLCAVVVGLGLGTPLWWSARRRRIRTGPIPDVIASEQVAQPLAAATARSGGEGP
jgi:hypothetical protein